MIEEAPTELQPLDDEPGEWWRLAAFIAGVVAVLGLAWAGGGWALAFVIVGLMTVIAGHELGHYTVARASGMAVSDYFVGFGPVVWSTRRKGIRYGVRLIPVGGYVKVPGMTWTDKVDEAIEHRTYRVASTPRKVLFAAAGPLANLVMAFVVTWAALVLVGVPSSSHIGVAGLAKWNVASPASRAGIAVGSRIVAVDGRTITSVETLSSAITASHGRPLTLTLSENGTTHVVHLRAVRGSTRFTHGVPVGTSNQWFIGVELKYQDARIGAVAGVGQTASDLWGVTTASTAGLYHVFSPAGLVSLVSQIGGKASNSRPESVVGVARTAVQISGAGLGIELLLLANVNIFVGLFNLLPILPLDGGYVAISLYERLRSRRGARHHANLALMTPVIYAFLAVLAVVFLSTLILDLVHPLGNPLG